METLIVVLLVSLAAAWFGWRILRRLKPAAGKPTCGSSCEGCAWSGASRRLPLAQHPLARSAVSAGAETET